MLQGIRERLTLVLIALLPLHALLVTVGTKALEGPGHPPMTALALWKEGLLAVILLIAFIEWMRRPSQEGAKRFAPDEIDVPIFLLLLLSVIVTAFTHGQWKLYLFGFKYDFIPLIAFVVLRRVFWSEEFLRSAMRVLMAAGGVVALYGIVSLVLPQGFFVWLGYSDLHSLYRPDAPLAAYQQVGGLPLRRIQSTFSGPNQFGLWLLIPWSIGLVSLITCERNQKKLFGFLHIHTGREFCIRSIYIFLIGIALILTFSRSAWIAAVVIFFLAQKMLQPREDFRRSLIRMSAVVVEVAALIALLMPGALTRFSSTFDHFLRPLEAVQTMVAHPYGLGLGTAGPASNRVSDTCVFLEGGADTTWAADRPELCIFVGGVQAQPSDRMCVCPVLTENWYLQIGMEMGLIGFATFITVILFVLISLKRRKNELEIFLLFFGVAVAALFLHAWEDSAVAYTVWILAALQPLFPDHS